MKAEIEAVVSRHKAPVFLYRQEGALLKRLGIAAFVQKSNFLAGFNPTHGVPPAE